MLAIENPRRKILVLLMAAMLGLQSGCTPPGPRALLRGDELLRKGKSAEAIAELKRATELMPAEAHAWNLLGVAYHRAGQSALAVTAYRQALTRDRSNFVSIAHYNLGCLWLEQNNPAAAADELRSYTLITNSVAGLVKLGAAQSRLRQWDAAEHTFKAALQLAPRDAEVWNGIGVMHAQRNQRDALQCFSNALQGNPKYAPALLNWALLAQQNPATKAAALQRYHEYLATHAHAAQAETIKSLVRQLETELAPPRVIPTNPTPLVVNATRTNLPPTANAKALLSAMKSNALAAVAKTNLIVTVNTNLPIAPANLPVTVVVVTNQPSPRAALPEAFASERTKEPVVVSATKPATSDTAPGASPDGAPSTEDKKKPGFFSRLNPFRDKPPGATNEVARAVTSSSVPNSITNALPTASVPAVNSKPSFPRYRYASFTHPAAGNRANAERAARQAAQALRAGNTNEAWLDYQLAMTTDPTYFDAQYYAALLAFQSGDVKRALTGWETAVALEPESLNARYSFALALKQANFPYDAANELEKIIEAKATDARAHLALGNLYAQQLNDREKARAHYGKFLELEPRSSLAPTIRFWLAANP